MGDGQGIVQGFLSLLQLVKNRIGLDYLNHAEELPQVAIAVLALWGCILRNNMIYIILNLSTLLFSANTHNKEVCLPLIALRALKAHSE